MSKPLKPRRGTTAEQNAFVGEAYEVTYDTDKNTLVCRDGVTPGGFPLAKSAELETLAENIDDNVGTIREDTVAAAQDAARASAGKSGTVTLEGVAAEVAHLGAEVGELESGVGFNAAGKAEIVGWGMPDYSAGVTISAAPLAASPWTAPAAGVVTISIINYQGCNVYINNVVTGFGVSNPSSYNDLISISFPLSKGDKWYLSVAPYSFSKAYFYPFKGA